MTGIPSSKLSTSRKGKAGKEVAFLTGDSLHFVPSDGANTGPSSVEERKKRLALLEQDPLNVHQMILKHLQGEARAPITSVYELAKIITDSCVNLFDPYQAPDEFQFFDFFERSIGDVVSKLTMIEGRTTLMDCRVIEKHNASNDLRIVWLMQDVVKPSTLVSRQKQH
jgi:hypothetical protein